MKATILENPKIYFSEVAAKQIESYFPISAIASLNDSQSDCIICLTGEPNRKIIQQADQVINSYQPVLVICNKLNYGICIDPAPGASIGRYLNAICKVIKTDASQNYEYLEGFQTFDNVIKLSIE